MRYPWSKTVFPIAAIFSFRMLGLFLLIPVFTLYAPSLHGANATLIGIALGGYGLTQGLFQIPFGLLSDKFGRKPILTIGLICFALGSLLGAVTDSIYGMILARCLQGTGAIGSVLIALLADLTPDNQRTKAMAVIGMTIGSSFSLAMVLSPAIAHRYGLSGIFYLTAGLALLALVLLHFIIPSPFKEPFHSDSETHPKRLKSVFWNAQLQRLNLGIFCQHFILTATFFVIPMILKDQINQGHLTQQWHFYFPLIALSFFLMAPFIVLAEKKKKMKPVFLAAIATTGLSQLILMYAHIYWIGLCGLLFAYFVAFNILEATLPSLISKQANPNQKGTAMGIYSTSQFLGIFAGGSLAGILYSWGNQSIFLANALLALIWFVVAMSMKSNVNLVPLTIHYASSSVDEAQIVACLLNVPGVKDVAYSQHDSLVYLRIDEQLYEHGSVEKTLHKLS